MENTKNLRKTEVVATRDRLNMKPYVSQISK